MPEPVTTSTSILAGLTGANPEVTAKYAALFAGFIGGVISMRFVKGMNRWERLSSILAGAVMAHYIAFPMASLFSVADYVETVGFLVGLFGISICGALFDAIKKSDIWGLVERRVMAFGKSPSGYDDPDKGGSA